MTKNIKTALILALIAVSVAMVFSWQVISLKQDASLKEIRLFPENKELPQFSLIDESSRVFNNGSLLDKWTLLFFGYSHCPDVCPTTLSNLAQIVTKLPLKQQQLLQVVFVSVDPERDTPVILKTYVEYFNTNFKAATGTSEQLTAFAKSLGAIYFKGEVDENGNYSVDHTSKIFLVNPLGQRAGLFDGQIIPPAKTYPVDRLKQDLVNILKHY